ncbi:MAG: hypothetical protein IT370_06705 [Deltaproteobacteria bacterium]|nr:hypothetical protein [Deltaproteobacteria bacterium]
MRLGGWLVLGVMCGWLVAAHAEEPAPTAPAGTAPVATAPDAPSISARWQRAQQCAGAHAARDRASCETRCEADRKVVSERPPITKAKRGKKTPPAGATCRCQCTAAALGVLEKSCGELGLVSGLAELGPGARACVSPGLSPEAACVLRCDDVLETCVDGCDNGISLVSEPTTASCISGCYAFQTSCMGLCADKGQRPASLSGSAKR